MFAGFVQGPLIRLIPVGMVLLALQRTIFVELQVHGVIIQLMLATAAAAGAAGGVLYPPMPGTGCCSPPSPVALDAMPKPTRPAAPVF